MKNYIIVAFLAAVTLRALSADLSPSQETYAGDCNLDPRKEKRCQSYNPGLKGQKPKRVEMWYFNATTRNCSTFMYSGCGGNANRFPTKEMCLDICNPPTFSFEEFFGNNGDPGNDPEANEPASK
uniref:Putative bpti/kunitz family of serine protease inhibitor n=1 Tax=Amblyomma americanum TaxID=6943 RepID=A0A0C9RWN8_AMBAM